MLCYAVGIISWPISKVLDYVLGDEHTVRLPLPLMSASAGYLKRAFRHHQFMATSKEGRQASACVTMHMSGAVDAEYCAAGGVLSLPDNCLESTLFGVETALMVSILCAGPFQACPAEGACHYA